MGGFDSTWSAPISANGDEIAVPPLSQGGSLSVCRRLPKRASQNLQAASQPELSTAAQRSGETSLKLTPNKVRARTTRPNPISLDSNDFTQYAMPVLKKTAHTTYTVGSGISSPVSSCQILIRAAMSRTRSRCSGISNKFTNSAGSLFRS
jgi:hypothetical protein